MGLCGVMLCWLCGLIGSQGMPHGGFVLCGVVWYGVVFVCCVVWLDRSVHKVATGGFLPVWGCVVWCCVGYLVCFRRVLCCVVWCRCAVVCKLCG